MTHTMSQSKISNYTMTLSSEHHTAETPTSKQIKRGHDQLEPTTPSPIKDRVTMDRMQLMEDIKTVVKNVFEEQFESILTSKLEVFKKDIESKLTDCEKSVKSLEADFHQKITTLENNISEQTSINSKLQNRIAELEKINRKNNLKFFNLKYGPNDSDAIIERKILNTLQASNIQLPPVAISQIKKSKSSLTVTFQHYKDKRHILSSSKQIYLATKVSLSDDFPPEIEAVRKTLYPIMKNARRLNHEAFMSYDKIMIDRKSYSISNIHTLPKALHPESATTITEKKITAFFNKLSPLSNHFPCNVKFEEKLFNCSEQAYLYNKATFLGDLQSAEKIIIEVDPAKQKQLSKKITFTKEKEQQWLNVRKNVMERILWEKFSQNKLLKLFLDNTENNILVEGNAHDDFWGAGVSIYNADIWTMSRWPGKNNLGQILMTIREKLRTLK